MRKTPGIQAADIIAWGMNRETFAKEGDMVKYLGHILRTVVPSLFVIWDEAKMRQHYKQLLYYRCAATASTSREGFCGECA